MYSSYVLFFTQVVQERLLCHGIVGRQGCKELIMCVDLTCRFVAPMLRISSRQLKFHLEKVGQKIITPGYCSKLYYVSD